MDQTENINYYMAQQYFEEAEKKGQKLYLGDFETNLWLHKEHINFDSVIEIARQSPDSRIAIISDGKYKGFYIYSQLKKNCIKLISSAVIISKAQMV